MLRSKHVTILEHIWFKPSLATSHSHLISLVSAKTNSPLKINISPEKWWLEDDNSGEFLLKWSLLMGHIILIFGRVRCFNPRLSTATLDVAWIFEAPHGQKGLVRYWPPKEDSKQHRKNGMFFGASPKHPMYGVFTYIYNQPNVCK